MVCVYGGIHVHLRVRCCVYKCKIDYGHILEFLEALYLHTYIHKIRTTAQSRLGRAILPIHLHSACSNVCISTEKISGNRDDVTPLCICMHSHMRVYIYMQYHIHCVGIKIEISASKLDPYPSIIFSRIPGYMKNIKTMRIGKSRHTYSNPEMHQAYANCIKPC